MTQITYIAANGSRWTVTPTVMHYGKPVPAGREFWAHCHGESIEDGVVGFYASTLDAIKERLGYSPIAQYKARWADFRIDCENLKHARKQLFHGYANEDIGADEGELWDRVFSYEDRFAHEPVSVRAEHLRSHAYRYADL